MITRRAMLAGALAVLTTAAVRLPPEGRRAFRMIRNGDPIGSHVLTFRQVQEGWDIGIAVECAVGLGPLTLYRYGLRGTERWRNGGFVSLETRTDNDGEAEYAQILRDDRGLWVEGSAGPRYRAPDQALPATHWNSMEMSVPWINPQNGKLLHPSVRSESGHYRLSGDVEMELWYDQSGNWIGLQAPGKDGSEIRYELVEDGVL